MSKPTEIKIDQATLPKDGQKVRWQTHKEINEEGDIWKTGTFARGENIFCIGFAETANEWDLSYDVVWWKKF